MELILGIPVVGGFFGTFIAFVVALSIVVFVHEYGHYIVGRWCGIHALKFSLGFGPVIAKRTDKRGTVWQVAALPLGGMVQFLGDADGASAPDHEALKNLDPDLKGRAFHNAAIWRRALTVAAGPFANFIFSAVVFAGLALWVGAASDRPVLGEVEQIPGLEIGLEIGDEVVAVNGEPIDTFGDFRRIANEMSPAGPLTLDILRAGQALEVETPHPSITLVGRVLPSSAARRAGLEAGDYIDVVNGQKMRSFSDLLAIVDGSNGETLEMEVLRNGAKLDMEMAPLGTPVQTAEGGFETRYRIGVINAGIYLPERESVGVLYAAEAGVRQVFTVIETSLSGIYHMIAGALSPSLLQGPLGIAQMSGETAKLGGTDFIMFVALISTAVGMLNLFPVPVLDGGHLAMFAYEAVRGKAPSQKVLGWIMPTGLALVLLLMLFATYNDIVRLAADFSS